MLVLQGLLLPLAACSAPSIPDFRSVDTVSVAARVETLGGSDTAGAAAVSGLQIVANQGETLALVDPIALPLTLRQVSPTVEDARRLPDDTILIATSDGLWVYSDYLYASPLQEKLSAAPRHLGLTPGSVWMGGPSGLFRYQAGTLKELRWEEQPLTTAFADGATEAGLPVVWAGNENGTVAFGESTEGWVEVARLDGFYPDGLGADRENRVYATGQGALLVRENKAWKGYQLPSDVTMLQSNPAAVGAWVAGFGTLYWTDGKIFEEITEIPEDVLLPQAAVSVDELGRLVVAGEEHLYRFAHAPVVAIAGLRDGGVLTGETTVYVQPSDPDEVESVEVEVDGAAVEVTDSTAVLDPFQWLDDAEHQLQATVQWNDGSKATGSLRFTVGSVGNAIWEDNVLPIYESRCAKCHGGSTQTVLDSKDQWESKVDSILEEVASGRMPLGGPRLSGAEISVIRAWKDGGFQ